MEPSSDSPAPMPGGVAGRFGPYGGRYVPEDLQVFNVGMTGGAYWFTRGWNFYAMAAWAPSVVASLRRLPGRSGSRCRFWPA